MEDDNRIEISLKVAEAQQDDIGQNSVRIGTAWMKQIGVRPGEFVEVEGNRKTVAKVDRAHPGDLGLNIIRMDGTTRKNAKAAIGENVIVRKAEVYEADSVNLSPLSSVQLAGAEELIGKMLLDRAVTKGDIVTLGSGGGRTSFSSFLGDDIMRNFFDSSIFPSFQFGFSEFRFLVTSASPKGFVVITENTDITVSKEQAKLSEEATSTKHVSYEDVGGLKDEVSKIREMVEIPLKHPEIFMRLGVTPPRGVLLYGPPGAGKTLLARAVADESDAHFITINGPEVMSKWVGDAEKKLREIFDDAEKNAPSIIFIDEIDAIATKREESIGEVEHRVVSQLLTLMDGLKSRGKVIVIAATNRPNAIDPALRRPGRFDREIMFGVPNEKGRQEILNIHTRNMPMDKSVDLPYISKITHGFVGADIESLIKEAAMNVIRRNINELNIKEGNNIPKAVLEKLTVTMDDFREALRFVRPSAMREVLVERPSVGWNDVGGLGEVKDHLKEAIDWPIKHPDSFRKIGITPPKGILLFGPPGTGKTLLAKAVAHETESNFIAIKGPEIYNKYVGESEKRVREIFDKARQVSPSIIFIDELDSIASSRSNYEGNNSAEQVVNQLLTELDGIEPLKNVIVIGATNRIDKVDSAILRTGRFDNIVFVPPPDEAGRKEILKVYIDKMPIEGDKEELINFLVKKTEGYVGSDIERLTKEAGMNALRNDISATKVTKDDFEKALELVRPSLSQDEIKKYEDMAKKLYTKKEKVKELNYFG
ncbi:MAG: AAA family ATPase, CDC48 subfamily [Candidatus Parvarchaeum acidophilus ARMAN-5]|jgi:transitional endoplasmic reticulum ATPase|uniref:AAA family ATPase, CDC48 subfamily n=1 Tax=Candidatus Parvarchaeum acidophilus ARMAN-5 TaxID=662762 RepID=D6GVZ2_PARA5|nr:MAG: AAA family ATPase, CDC48 subfamily [Candidatus Parvarchaeum acidophilus ARMAN-5]EFD92611.1 MAG: AAA family ATPase, CDC48 subfamily [Candidatus Parvarchaeum acidophilus ARMAN-5]